MTWKTHLILTRHNDSLYAVTHVGTGVTFAEFSKDSMGGWNCRLGASKRLPGANGTLPLVVLQALAEALKEVSDNEFNRAFDEYMKQFED